MLCFYIMRNRSIHERLIRYWYITLFSGNWIVLFCVDVHHSTTCIQYEDSIYLMPTYMIYHLSNLEKKYTFMILENYIAFIRKSSQTPFLQNECSFSWAQDVGMYIELNVLYQECILVHFLGHYRCNLPTP